MTALEEIKKGNHPDRIWATVNGMSTRLPDGARQLVGGWSQDADRTGAVEYVLASTLESLQRENEELRNLADRLKQEAQIHAMEARSANSTVNEIYQIISGSKGEPANYHGAEPVRKYVKAAEAEVKRLRGELSFYSCDGSTCDCIPGQEDANSVTCGFRARTALASTGGEHHADK